MSGVFWEESLQPDLVESVTTFASSSLTLAMALPMSILNVLCIFIMFTASLLNVAASPVLDVIMFTASLLNVAVSPVLDVLGQAGEFAMSSTGLEDFWSADHTLVLGLGLYTLLALLLYCGGTSCQQLFSKVTSLATGILWITNFLIFPVFESAQFARVGLLSLGLQLASLCIRGLLLEHSAYRHGAAPGPLDTTAPGYLDCVNMEAMAALIVCAFGYPGLSAGDEASRYYCVIPFLAMQIIYFNSVLKVDVAEGVTANGYVTALEATTAKIEEVKEVCGKKVAEVKEKIETAVENAVTENPEVLEAASNVEAAGQELEEKVEEVVEAVKETVDKIGEIVEEKIEEVKADPLFQKLLSKLTGLYTAIASRVSTLLAPLANLASATATKLSTVPWLSLTLLASTWGSHLLYAAAWLHLTGSGLALALPLLSLALPLALDTLGPRLPPALPAYIREAGSLATAGVTYILLAGGGQE